jgi:hypothetical protein
MAGRGLCLSGLMLSVSARKSRGKISGGKGREIH